MTGTAATRRDPNDYTLIGLGGIRLSCGAKCAKAARAIVNHKMSIEAIFPNCYNLDFTRFLRGGFHETPDFIG